LKNYDYLFLKIFRTEDHQQGRVLYTYNPVALSPTPGFGPMGNYVRPVQPSAVVDPLTGTVLAANQGAFPLGYGAYDPAHPYGTAIIGK
jgi:hypothetical protein